MIKVTILSPNHALRVGLREMLAHESGIEVISEGTILDDVIRNETEVLVLTSVSSARLRELAEISFGVLLLTDDQEEVRLLVESNVHAWGVISASASGDELLVAVRAVGEGLWVGAPSLMKSLIRSQRRGDDSEEESLLEPLTAREREVLQLMAEGLANKQIAVKLGISEHTVKFHLSSLYAKLNVSSRTEAVKRGLGLGLLSL